MSEKAKEIIESVKKGVLPPLSKTIKKEDKVAQRERGLRHTQFGLNRIVVTRKPLGKDD